MGGESFDYKTCFINDVTGNVLFCTKEDLDFQSRLYFRNSRGGSGNLTQYVYQGFERKFDSYDDKDYKRLHIEKVKAHKLYIKTSKKKLKEKHYNLNNSKSTNETNDSQGINS